MFNKKRFIFDFLNKRKLTVLASVTPGGRPEAAVMEFAVTEDLLLIFDTPSTSRKYANFKANPHVAFAFGWEDWDTVQYEGKVEEIAGEERERYRKVFLVKHPDAVKWDVLGVAYFKAIPTWIRYTAMDQRPWEIVFA